jgi:membrane-associated protein
MQKLLGNPNFTWAKHIDKVVVVVVFLSVVPIFWKAFKHWRHGEKPGAAVVEAVTAVDPPAEEATPAPTGPTPAGSPLNVTAPVSSSPPR